MFQEDLREVFQKLIQMERFLLTIHPFVYFSGYIFFVSPDKYSGLQNAFVFNNIQGLYVFIAQLSAISIFPLFQPKHLVISKLRAKGGQHTNSQSRMSLN